MMSLHPPSIKMHHRAAFPIALGNCCYSLTLLDGAEGRRHISKKSGLIIFVATSVKISDSDINLSKLIDEASAFLS